jgi:3-phosphoglycerate kinase
MKLKDILQNYNNLIRTGLLKQAFPAKIGYAIGKNALELEKEKNIYEKERVKLCEQLCKKDKDGKPVTIKQEDSVTYDLDEEANLELQKELEELLETETEINLHKINPKELEKLDTSDRYYTPSATELIAIDFMIEDGE